MNIKWNSQWCDLILSSKLDSYLSTNITSVSSISPFKIKKSWIESLLPSILDNLEDLFDEEVIICCISTSNGIIKFLSEKFDFNQNFCIKNSITNQCEPIYINKIYTLSNLYGIDKLCNSSEDLLKSKIFVCFSSNDTLYCCDIPFYFIFASYLRNTIQNKYKDSDIINQLSAIVLPNSIEIPLYKINSTSSNLLSWSHNLSNTQPCILIAQINEYSDINIALLLFTKFHDIEFHLSFDNKRLPPVTIYKTVNLPNIVKSNNKSILIPNGITCYPFNRQYLWLFGIKSDILLDDNEYKEMNLNELDSITQTTIYILESSKYSVDLIGQTNLSYNITHINILNIIENNKDLLLEQDKKIELTIRIISATEEPSGLLGCDMIVRKPISENIQISSSLWNYSTNISSIIFMPLNEFVTKEKNINDEDLLGFSFGLNGKSQNKYLKNTITITTLCTLPMYLNKLKLDQVLKIFPAIFCGLSNGEWRIYTLQNEDDIQKGYQTIQNKTIFNSNSMIPLGYFSLKGLHTLINITSESVNSGRVISSSWSVFKTLKSSFSLSIAAVTDTGKTYTWFINNQKKGELLKNKIGKSQIDKDEICKNHSFNKMPQRILRKKLIEDELSSVSNIQNNIFKNLKKEKLISKDQEINNISIVEIMDEHIRRIDNRLKQVEDQEYKLMNKPHYEELITQLKSENLINNRKSLSQVPECLTRSVSPRKGCNVCYSSEEHNSEPRKLWTSSKYATLPIRRYKGYDDENDNYNIILQSLNFKSIASTGIKYISMPNSTNLIIEKPEQEGLIDTLVQDWLHKMNNSATL
ncbi:hypothetical protein ACR3K2_31890 [Cryptosporidium serpentis]